MIIVINNTLKFKKLKAVPGQKKVARLKENKVDLKNG